MVSSKVPGGIANEFAEITNKKKDIDTELLYIDVKTKRENYKTRLY